MKQRVITAVAFFSVFIATMLIGSWPFYIFIAFIALTVLFELMRMKGIEMRSPIPYVAYIALLLYVLGPWLLDFGPGISDINLLIGTLVSLVILMLVPSWKTDIDEIALIIFGIFYIGNAFQTMINIRETNLSVLIYLMLIIWMTDVGAYLLGRAIGKTPMAPDISPNKTVEGMFGGLILSLIVANLYLKVLNVDAHILGHPLIIIFLSFATQLGDLIESSIKRTYNVKDSGKILPGHGGMFDRFDSTIFVMNVVKLLVYLV